MIDSVDDKVDADVKALADYKTEVSDTYETKANVVTAINSVYASATTAADADATAKVNAAKEELNNSITAATNTLQNSIDAVDDKVDALSGVTETVKATADSAVQTASVDSGVSVEKEGTELKFSFDEFIIDCGDF